MQTKTISKIIKSKLEEWLETIEDKVLVEKVKDNILVSWWCITSMLLNEEVNDYDIYINDINILKKLTKYYTDWSGTITILDWRQKESLEKELWDKHSSYSVAINTLKEDQIKLFFNWDSGLAVNKNKKEEELNYEPLFFSPNAISLSNNIQIVCRFHWDNEQIHKTFDFIHATNYFTFKDWLVTNKDALESILTKQLRYQGSLYPLTSIIRMKKFIKRWWNISAWEILKIMFQISELNLKDPNVLEEQLIGVDVAYFWLLIDIMRWSKDEKITSSYINTLIDRVFNKDDSDIDEHR